MEQTNNILFKEHKRSDGSLLGEIKLNSPKNFNALDLDIVSSLKKQLEQWQNQEDISLVYMHAEGEKAFCAGGNVKKLYHSIADCKKNKTDPGLAAATFFETEYRTNFLMHRYTKPIVLWGQGIVMGGGLGLFAGASHPVVTETSSFAMPEINIGLFPDVGGSYFLNGLPKNIGLYLALTSYRFNATEAQFLNMSNLCFENSSRQKLFDFLLSTSFQNKEEFNTQILNFQKEKGMDLKQENWIKEHQNHINILLESKDIQTIYKNFMDSKIEDAKWIKNKETFLKGSPSSAGIICEQLERGKNMSLKEVLQMELVIAMQCSRHSDFFQGVKAVLIDKTGNPKWNPDHIEKIKDSWIEEHFQPLSGWENPLKNL